jgi:AraC family transcriptional regulator
MQMSVVAPACPVDVAFDAGEALVISCILDPSYFTNATGIEDWSERHTLACLGLSSPVIGMIFDRLVHEVRVVRQQSDGVAQRFIAALAGEIARGLLRSLGERPHGELAPWQLQSIYDLAADEATERRLTAKLIAHVCGISTRHLMRAFKATTGLTLHQFLNETRMQRAMKLLGSEDKPVKDVATRLGFSTPSAFSAAFLHTVGATPSEYRMALRAN